MAEGTPTRAGVDEETRRQSGRFRPLQLTDLLAEEGDLSTNCSLHVSRLDRGITLALEALRGDAPVAERGLIIEDIQQMIRERESTLKLAATTTRSVSQPRPDGSQLMPLGASPYLSPSDALAASLTPQTLQTLLDVLFAAALLRAPQEYPGVLSTPEQLHELRENPRYAPLYNAQVISPDKPSHTLPNYRIGLRELRDRDRATLPLGDDSPGVPTPQDVGTDSHSSTMHK